MAQELTKKYIAEQKKKLTTYQQNLEVELSGIAKKGKKGYQPAFPKYGSKEEDNILEMEDFAENLSIEKKLNQLLRRTRRAIKKIDRGRYGRCERCKKPIKKERLDVYPLAADCIVCAKKRPKGFWGRVWPFRR